MKTLLWQLLLQACLIGLNAIFACAEIAVLSVSQPRLQHLQQAGNRSAQRLARLTAQPARFLAVIQVAITLSGFLGSAFAADHFSGMLVTVLLGWGVPISAQTLDGIAVVLITLVLSYLTLVLGELVPKRLAMKRSEQLSLRLSGLLALVSRLFAPIVWLLTVSANGVLRLLRVDPHSAEPPPSEEEIRMLVDAGSEGGAIDSAERELIENVFEFDDRTVGEFATHRTELEVLYLAQDADTWDRQIRQGNHTRYPVCGSNADEIVGILYTKAYFRLDTHQRERVLQQAVQSALFVPEGVRADVLFRRMQQTRNHFAVVLDEYGGTVGVVTMNDLLSQLVGDLQEETVEEMPAVQQLHEGCWRLRGDVPLAEAQAVLGVTLPVAEYDTFGGYVFGAYGSVPADGSSFTLTVGALCIEAERIDEHRLCSVLVKRCTAAQTEQAD